LHSVRDRHTRARHLSLVPQLLVRFVGDRPKHFRSIHHVHCVCAMSMSAIADVAQQFTFAAQASGWEWLEVRTTTHVHSIPDRLSHPAGPRDAVTHRPSVPTKLHALVLICCCAPGYSLYTHRAVLRSAQPQQGTSKASRAWPTVSWGRLAQQLQTTRTE
jgi:hypothetical protein